MLVENLADRIVAIGPPKVKAETLRNRRRNGEPPRTRTWNPQIKSLLLYQLS